jgi:hypothetical protein
MLGALFPLFFFHRGRVHLEKCSRSFLHYPSSGGAGFKGACLGPLCSFVLFFAAQAFCQTPSAEQLAFFETQVRPILAERCYKCHSVDAEKPKGGLLLDSAEGVMKGGEDGLVVVPGEPEKSKLVEAIRYQNPELQMPPKGRLSDEQVAAFVEWIKMGAPWPAEPPRKPAGAAPVFDLEKRRREHWAWQSIKPQPLPSVQNAAWPSAPSDRFILAKLESSHMHPAPAADRSTLIRRLYFDLIGLPPTPDELNSALADASPEAYEKLVDRLLASPRFGERWARHWLDLVRYAETLGHEFDYPLQNAWKYRDYVIRAFNADVPYNQFVTEHIAGDLLDSPRRNPTQGFNESVIGTGFFWLGQRDHSPVDVRQHQAELVDNQIDVMSKTFLGLTVACARCHDHKFDAIASKDFYALYGILESSHYAQKAIDSPEAIDSKIEKLRSLKEQIRAEAVHEWSGQMASISKYLLASATNHTQSTNSQTRPHLDSELIARWDAAIADKSVADPNHPFYPWLKATDRTNTQAQVGAAGASRNLLPDLASNFAKQNVSAPDTNTQVFAQASNQGFDGWFADGEAFRTGFAGAGALVVGDTNLPLTILSARVVNDSVISRRLEGALRSPTFEIRHRYCHILAAGRASRIRFCVDNFTMIRDPIYGGLLKRLDTDRLTWLTFDLDMWQGHHAFIELSDVPTPDPAQDANSEGYGVTGWLSAGQVVFSNRSSPPESTDPPAWQQMLGSQPVASLESLADRYQTACERALEGWSSGHAADSSHADSAANGAQLTLLNWLLQNRLLSVPDSGPLPSLIAQYHQVESRIPSRSRVPAMADGNGVDEHVFIRGNPKSLGPVAPRQFLTAITSEKTPPFSSGSGRLELARCITDDSDPLLARVMVNRVWVHLFGRGIVPTPDDFGALGQPPTHPELLDWLANWYRTDAGWSTKKLIRLLVSSSAYRMSSTAEDPQAEEKDPNNALFHRMSLKRLEGECIRDAMLTISGRLDLKMFGPSVPTHLTEFMDGRGRPGSSGPIDGAGRRSIYLEVRRNFISSFMRTFDTPVPFTTIGKRTVSNVPAQSLILLNDPFVLSQARLWAQHVLSDEVASASSSSGPNHTSPAPLASPESRIRKMYLAAFARVPSQDEQAKAIAFLKTQAAAYGLAENEWAHAEQVWTDLCHVLFNVKEFIFIR